MYIKICILLRKKIYTIYTIYIYIFLKSEAGSRDGLESDYLFTGYPVEPYSFFMFNVGVWVKYSAKFREIMDGKKSGIFKGNKMGWKKSFKIR